MIRPLKELLDMYVIQNVPIAAGATLSVGDAVIIDPVGTGVVTVTVANPAVFTQTGHGLVVGQTVQFGTTGVLPTGITAGTIYYVIAAGFGANTFEVSLTLGGSAIAVTVAGSGTLFLNNQPSVIGAAGTTTVIFGTVVALKNNNLAGNVFLQESTVTAPLNNLTTGAITVDVLSSTAVTTYVADLDAPAGTTPNSSGLGYFNLTATINGELHEASYSTTTQKQFLSYGVNPGNASQVIGIWSNIARI